MPQARKYQANPEVTPAIMSNHFHLVVKIQREQALTWNMDEIVDCWTQLFSTPHLVARYRAGECFGMQFFKGQAYAARLFGSV